MIHPRLFSHFNIIVYACLSSFLMPGSLGQKPVLGVGTFTSISNLQCIRPGMNTLNLEGSINVNGSDASLWTGNGVEFRSTQALICTASLIECPPASLSGCYCEQFDESTQTFTVKFSRLASEIYSEQSIVMRIVRSDFSESVTSDGAMYPYVSGDVSARIDYGSKSKTDDIDGTPLDVPQDNQLVNMTVSGLRQPFTISYSTDISANNGEVNNTDHISIPVTSSTTLLTVSYEEDDYCQRTGSYSFNITSVPRQSPHLNLEALSKPACPVEGRGDVSIQATVDASGANMSHWAPTVTFRSEDNEDLCSVRLDECPPSDVSAHDCYCQGHNNVTDVYSITGNRMANALLSGKNIYMEIVSTDYNVRQRSESDMYPSIDRDDVRITMIYANDKGNRRFSPPVNNSMLGHPEDNQRLTFTISGLKEPFSIAYLKLNVPVQIEVTDNQSSATFSIDDDTERITLSYDESLNCNREGVYFFTMEEDSDSDDLSTGAIVGIIFGAILLVVVIVFFIIVYLIARARDNNKDTYQRSESVEERGTIIDYSSKDVEDGRGVGNGASYENRAYEADVPTNSSSVVMNPVFDDGINKDNEYTSLDTATQNEPGPAYDSLNNGQSTRENNEYTSLDDVPQNEPSSEDDNLNGVKPSRDGPYVSIIRTSL